MKYLINFHFSFTYQDILKLFLATSYFWLKTYADSNNNTEGIFNTAKHILFHKQSTYCIFHVNA